MTFDVHWFTLSSPLWRVRRTHIRLWNWFNRRVSTGEHFWGVGVLQVGNRHLLYVGHSGVSILFIGRTP